LVAKIWAGLVAVGFVTVVAVWLVASHAVALLMAWHVASLG
jgi:hypothetical protein